jgi:putative ABC transport system permease protein
MTLFNTLRTAWRGLSGNKLRAVLTMLGVIIGVASVIAMLALGNGARLAVEASFRMLGSDTIQIGGRQEIRDGEFAAVGQILSYREGLAMPQEVALVDFVEMSVNGYGKVRHGRVTLDMDVTGVTADIMETLVNTARVQPVGWPEGQALHAADFIGRGRFFTAAEVMAGEKVCVLGYDTTLDLFQGDDPLDQTILVNRERCLVIGVVKELEASDPDERNQSEPNEGLYMPISTAIEQLFEEEPSVNMTAHVSDESRMEEAKFQVADYLRQRHGLEKNADGEYDDDFHLTTRQDILGAQQEAAQTLSLLLAAMAVVSLMVGGIGIMNVMLVSVSERTREIGVRVALGARGRDVVAQFLSEAVLMSGVGGVLGIAVGVLSIPVAATLNQGQAVLAADSIPLAFGVALLTGVLFGLYPAARAAGLNPIEALRYE